MCGVGPAAVYERQPGVASQAAWHSDEELNSPRKGTSLRGGEAAGKNESARGRGRGADEPSGHESDDDDGDGWMMIHDDAPNLLPFQMASVSVLTPVQLYQSPLGAVRGGAAARKAAVQSQESAICKNSLESLVPFDVFSSGLRSA